MLSLPRGVWPLLQILPVVLILTLGVGCRSAQVYSTRPDIPPSPSGVVPSGTLAVAQLHQPLSTRQSQRGDRFTAELLDPLVDSEGHAQIPKGSVVEGVVQRTRSSAIAGRSAAIELGVLGLRSEGERLIPIQAEVASSPVSLGSAWGRGALAFLAGAAAGAGTGLAIDSGSGPVVASAALIGACTASLASWLFGRRDAELPAGSIVTLRLTEDFGTNLAKASRPAPPTIRQRRSLVVSAGQNSDQRSDSSSAQPPNSTAQEGKRSPSSLPGTGTLFPSRESAACVCPPASVGE